MFKLDRYIPAFLVLGILACFPLALPSSSTIDQGLDPRFNAIPYQIGDWHGQDVEIDQLTYDILETKNILSRVYQNSAKEQIHLMLVGSDKDRRVAHPPEVCYTSSHYQILNSQDKTLNVGAQQIPAKRFVAQDEHNTAHQEKVLYLYKVGDRFTANYYAQQLQFAWDRLARKETQVLLIRLSATGTEPFEEFLTQILSHLN